MNIGIKYNKLYKFTFTLFIILSIVLIFYSLFFNKKAVNGNNKDDPYFIVCSKYNKSTDFLDEFEKPIKYTVLEKGKDVPNIANESTTYLYYIINNYYSLPENIIFIHDENESWHHEGKITIEIYKWIDEYEKTGKTYYELNSHNSLTKFGCCKQNLNDTDNKAYNELWNDVFYDYIGDFEYATPITGKCCSQFIVSRDNIKRYPVLFYKKFYNWLIENTTGEGNGSQEDLYSGYNTGRYAEYSWRYIFGNGEQ